MKRISKKIRIGILIVAILLLGLGATLIFTGCLTKGTKVVNSKESDDKLWTCGMHPWVIQKGPGQCPICGMNLVPKETVATDTDPGDRKILYWVSSMDPMYIRQEPGKDTMGMDLVPVYEDQATGGTAVSVDPAIIQSIGVKYATVVRGPMELAIKAPAHVDYDEDHLAVLSTRTEGYIDKLWVTSPGTTVKKGDKLFDFYAPKLYSAQEEYLIALKVGDSRLSNAAKERLKLLGVSDDQIAGIRKRGSSHALTITAPMDGTVVSMGGSGGGLSSDNGGALITGGSGMGGGASSGGGGMGGMGGGSGGGGGFSDSGGGSGSSSSGMTAGSGSSLREGSFLAAGVPVFTITDLSTVWVYAHIYNDQLPYVHAGMPAELELDYLPGQTFAGTVDFVYPYLEKLTRDIRVRLVFANADGSLLPEMYGNVSIKSKITDDALIIPEEAVIFSGEHRVVFTPLPGNKFMPVEIKVGPSDGNGHVQVLSGLTEGQSVVTSAQFLLDSESRMQEAINKMLANGNGQTPGAPSAQAPASAPVEEQPPATQSNDMSGMDMSGKSTVPSSEKEPVVAPKTEKPETAPKTVAKEKPVSEKQAVEKPAEKWPNLAPYDPRALWECPMPEDRYYAAEPGNDPICGMKLVPHDPVKWKKEHSEAH
jgi:multidrug efflux pump subunit AcrA (membrane-fusion protein)